MVASYEIGEALLSYVLVPGTGTNLGTRPLYLNLRSSSSVRGLGPLHTIQPTASSVTSKAKEPNHNEKEKEEKASPVKSSCEQKVESNSELQHKALSLSGGNRALKRQRGSEIESFLPASKSTKVEESPAACTTIPDPEIIRLQKLCMDLKRQNDILNRELTMFHQMFKNKECQASFVRLSDKSS